MSANIREATQEDLPRLIELWLTLITYHDQFAHSMELVDAPEVHIKDNLSSRMNLPSTKIWLYELDGNPVAMLICMYSDGYKAMKLQKRGYVAETVVDDNYRGKGIGADLYAHAEKWLKEQGADHIELQVGYDNRRSVDFWEEMGFSKTTFHMIKKIK